MAADAVDIDSARTGEQRAGLYFSVWGLLKKGAAAAGTELALIAVAFFGFDPTADVSLSGTAAGNSDSSLIWLAVLYSIVPAGLKLLALPFILRYPLTEERQRKIRARIGRRGVVLHKGTAYDIHNQTLSRIDHLYSVADIDEGLEIMDSIQ